MVRFAAAAIALAVTLSGISAYGQEIVLLDFWSPTCGPCMQMKPTVESFVNARYPIQQVDVSRDNTLSRQFNVTGVPCFVMLVDGHEVDRVVGATSSERLVQMFNRAKEVVAQNKRLRGQNAMLESAATTPTSNPGVPASDANISQSPGTGPPNGSTPTEFETKLLSSSVRLTVDYEGILSHGTGTIIDARDGDALIVTCGHLFRESQGKAPITVEVYVAGPNGLRVVEKVAAQVITYDLDRDVALVSIRPMHPVCVAPVAPSHTQMTKGDRVVSVGCNNGADPTIMDTRVTRIDPYKGLPTIEASGEPVVGRSGGGLFNSDGQLVGVCYAADPEGKSGLYASLDSIHHELNRIGLEEVYAKSDSSVPSVVRGQVNEIGPIAATETGSAPGAESASPSPESLDSKEQAALEEIMNRATESEVIIIIRSKDPGGSTELLHLDSVSPEFTQTLQALRQKGVATAQR